MPSERSQSALRIARKKAFSSISQFTDVLADKGLAYTSDAIGYWERLERFPDRNALLIAVQVLAEAGAITDQATVDTVLDEFDQRSLTTEEKRRYKLEFHPFIPNLPEKPPYGVLIGREEDITKITQLLTNRLQKSVVVLSGLGGIGKTALAYEIIIRLMGQNYFAELIWETAKLEEFTGIAIHVKQNRSINLRNILSSYARQLGLDHLVNQTADVLRQELRRVLQQKAYLVILDNLETLASARQAAKTLYKLVAGTESKVLITSRERLVDEGYLIDYFLRGLSESASIEFLQMEAKSRGADALLHAADALMRRVYDVTAGMPLALKLIVSQFLLGIALDDELQRLADAENERQLYKFIYYSIWGQLSTAAQKVLVGAATFAAPALRDMLIRVSQSGDDEFVPASQELIRMSLLWTIPHPQGAKMRYDMHAMTRWFVNSPLQDEWRNSQ